MRTIIISTETQAPRNFTFFPWGPDDTFSNRNLAENGRVRAAMGGALLARRLFEDPVIMTRYRDMMRTMLNEVWDDDTILGRAREDGSADWSACRWARCRVSC